MTRTETRYFDDDEKGIFYQNLLLNHSDRGSQRCLDIVVGFYSTIQFPYSHIHDMHQIFLQCNKVQTITIYLLLIENIRKS